MRTYLFGVFICLATTLTSFAQLSPVAQAKKPNVIFILTDDQGSIDLNCYGAKDLVTPHMDRIAKRGVRFTQFYAAAPVCAPSRAACMTGKTPQRAGITGNVGTRKGQKGGLALEHTTLAELMKSAGYSTAHIGKWHLGFEPHLLPNKQGFDYSFGHMGGCIDNYSHFYYWNGPNEHDLYRNGKEVFEDGKFFGDLMVREATDFIQRNREKPFFIYYAVNMPHYPYQGDTKWLRYYKDLPYPRNLYAAFMSTIDERIGQLMAALDKLDLTDDTIIVFQSDHGHSEEVRAHNGGGDAGPYRGHKFQLLEGGIRVPAMISWPKKIPTQQVRNQFATGCDWYPTLAHLCGIPMPNDTFDGKNLHDVIMSDEAKSPHKIFHWSNKRHQATRKGPWKYFSDQGQEFLYNIDQDPGESKDLKNTKPEIFKELKASHQTWAAEY